MKLSLWQSVKSAGAFVLPYKRQVVYALVALLFTASIMLSIGQGLRLLIDNGIATASSDQLAHYVFVFLGIVFKNSVLLVSI